MRTPRILAIGAAGALAAAGLAACGDDDSGGSDKAGSKIEVTATDTECKVGRTEAAAGTVTFTIANKGSKVTEFYVYAAGDRVMSEVENIVPGVSRYSGTSWPLGSVRTTRTVPRSTKGTPSQSMPASKRRWPAGARIARAVDARSAARGWESPRNAGYASTSEVSEGSMVGTTVV